MFNGLISYWSSFLDPRVFQASFYQFIRWISESRTSTQPNTTCSTFDNLTFLLSADSARKILHLKPMETPTEKYIKFQEKVKRTVYIDNLSPKVTEAVLRTALGQFGTVISVQFVPNYIESKNIPQCALVEMENAKQAKSIVAEMESYPFMMSGMPRPVRAFVADPGMFVDRPPKPDRKIQCKWMDPKDQDFAVAKEIKKLTNKHRAEASYLLTLQLEEEEKLHKQQADSLKANYRKFEMIDKVQSDGTLGRLGQRLKLKITDD